MSHTQVAAALNVAVEDMEQAIKTLADAGLVHTTSVDGASVQITDTGRQQVQQGHMVQAPGTFNQINGPTNLQQGDNNNMNIYHGLNAEDVQQMLQELRRQLQMAGAQNLKRFWIDYALVTEPETQPELVVGGRNEQQEQLLEFLRGEPDTISVQAESTEEAIAFLAATCKTVPAAQQELLLSRTMVVPTREAWDILVDAPSPKVLIPLFSDRRGSRAANTNGHHVVIPLGATEVVRGDCIELPRPKLDAIHDALTQMGVPETQTGILANLGRRSLLALRRKLAVSPEVQVPSWASPTQQDFPIAALLAGSWVDDHEPDQQLMAELTGLPYSTLLGTITRWSRTVDAPFRRIGNTWLVTAPEDAWTLLGSVFTSYHLSAFERVAKQALAHSPVAAEGEGEASPEADDPEASGLLKHGITDTLALLAAHHADAATRHLNLQSVANRVVTTVLGAPANWTTWAHHGALLTRLAEAAPRAFLDALEAQLRLPDNMEHLFQVRHFGTSPHVYLLFAVDLLAWDPALLQRVVQVLVKLHAFDNLPEQQQNRPVNSLLNILDAFRPITTAPVNARLAALARVRDQDPALGRRLTQQLMPGHRGMWMGPGVPRYRLDFPDEYPQATMEEVRLYQQQIFDLVVADARLDPSGFAFLLDGFRVLSHNQFQQVLDEMLQLDPSVFVLVRRQMLDTVGFLLSLQQEQDPSPFTSQLEERLRALENHLNIDPILRHTKWFESLPDIPGVSRYNQDSYWAALNTHQQTAIQTIYEESGLVGVLTLSEHTANAIRIGELLGLLEVMTEEPNELGFLDQYLGNSDSKLDDLARGFLIGRFQLKGQQWLDQLKTKQVQSWTVSQQVSFALVLPRNAETWDFVDHLGQDTKNLYWAKLSPWNIETVDEARAVQEFLNHNRAVAALSMLVRSPREGGLTEEQILGFLEASRAFNWQPEPGVLDSISFHLGGLLRRLFDSKKVDLGRLAALEWFFLPFFSRHDEPPATLQAWLRESPDFFVELISYIYLPDGEQPGEVTEDRQRKVKQSRELLLAWMGFPCRSEDPEVSDLDAEAFTAWVKRVLQLATEKNRLKPATLELARVLARSPYGADGSWPHEAVRDAIEFWPETLLDQFLHSAVNRNRGVTVRGLTDGGEQERQLAARYQQRANHCRATHPRTADILDRLAESYLREADHEDQDADLGQDLGG
ncbi:hypothetical protein [Deinococcus roseus]|nr:hypothetical protein [Deinococcus roseus]